MAITASNGKRIKRNDRRWYDGLQESSELKLTAIWMQQSNS